MKIAEVRALLTGATGGIGAAVAGEIARRGGKVLLSARDEPALQRLATTLDCDSESILTLAADVTRPDDRRRLCEAAQSWNGGINALINNAGVGHFGLFSDRSSDYLEKLFAVNILAPMHLCRSLLPHLRTLPRAQIVNVGSVFGTIAYPAHAAYSATKFALRGFSEALRRELADSSVRVHYLAPRATRTGFNCSEVEALNARFGIAMDPPESVALALCRMLETERAEQIIGWPEKLFARINTILPRLVDGALVKQIHAVEQDLAAAAATPSTVRLQRNES